MLKGFQSPNRYESYLSNEVLYIFVGGEAAKISELKVEGQKKSASSVSNPVEQGIFFRSPTLTYDIFAAS